MDPKNKLLQTTFFISLTFHCLILFPIPKIKIFSEAKKIQGYVNYFNLEIPPTISQNVISKESVDFPRAKTEKVQIKKKQAQNITIVERNGKKYIQRKKKIKNSLSKEIKNDCVITKNKTDSVLNNNKDYNDYYNLINEQLRQSIIYPLQFHEGEVVLSFILTADGNLKSLEIINEESTQNLILRETAIQIVKNASPFPPFPEHLLRIQLTFNVTICFQEKS